MPLFLMLMLIPTVIHMKMSSGQNQELTLYFEKQEKWYRTFYLLHKPPILNILLQNILLQLLKLHEVRCGRYLSTT